MNTDHVQLPVRQWCEGLPNRDYPDPGDAFLGASAINEFAYSYPDGTPVAPDHVLLMLSNGMTTEVANDTIIEVRARPTLLLGQIMLTRRQAETFRRLLDRHADQFDRLDAQAAANATEREQRQPLIARLQLAAQLTARFDDVRFTPGAIDTCDVADVSWRTFLSGRGVFRPIDLGVINIDDLNEHWDDWDSDDTKPRYPRQIWIRAYEERLREMQAAWGPGVGKPLPYTPMTAEKARAIFAESFLVESEANEEVAA